MKALPHLIAVIFIIALLFPQSVNLCAQCCRPLMLPSSFFEFDYLVRLCVHFGDPSLLPDDVLCSRSAVPGETSYEVPIYVYNIHDGIVALEFSIESNDSLVGFSVENCFQIENIWIFSLNDRYRMDIVLEACEPICGPALVGNVEVIPVSGEDPTWIDLTPNRQTDRMIAIDRYGETHYVYSPKHGGYIGSGYLYACQEPICEEPNSPIEQFDAEVSHGCSVKLTWIAGGGNRTVVLFRYDRFPIGYKDGEVLVEMESIPNEEQYFFHTEVPDGILLYYTAFSLTTDAGGGVINNSFVECSSADSVWAKCEIAVQQSSWGAIKNKFK